MASIPVETEHVLEHPEMLRTHEVIHEMVKGAKRSIDISAFYLAGKDDERGTRLEPIVAGLKAAAGRGVRVRIIADAYFHDNFYQETLAKLGQVPNIEVTKLDMSVENGSMHAKSIIVDGRALPSWLLTIMGRFRWKVRGSAYVGSANLDGLVLEHDLNVGVLEQDPRNIAVLKRQFKHDVKMSRRTPEEVAQRLMAPNLRQRLLQRMVQWRPITSRKSAPAARIAASPPQWLRRGMTWDEDEIIDAVKSAREHVGLHLFDHSETDWGGAPSPRLEAAIRLAAKNHAKVEIIVDHYNLEGEHRNLDMLDRLDAIDNVEVKVLKIPEFSGGPVPFARHSHAKYAVSDAKRLVVFEGNLREDYSRKFRNNAVVDEQGEMGKVLFGFFKDVWTSPYVTPWSQARAKTQ